MSSMTGNDFCCVKIENKIESIEMKKVACNKKENKLFPFFTDVNIVMSGKFHLLS